MTEASAYAESQVSKGSILLHPLKVAPLPRLRGGKLRFEPSHLSKREPYGYFFVVCKVFEDGRLVGSTRVDFEGRWKGQVLRLKENLGRKAVPTSDQMELEEFEGRPPSDALQDFPAGYRLRLPLGTGRILAQSDLEPIPLVNAGDPVIFTLNSETMSLSLDAIARSSGAMGQKVTLELKGGKRVQALVTGTGTVAVNWKR